MPQIINTNVASLNAQRNLDRSANSLQTSLQRLSSGLRINSAKDDAAGLAISNRFTSQIRGLNQAVRNANDGISVSQVAEGALGESTELLQRIRELAIQSANGSNGPQERAALNNEVQQLAAEIDRIANTTRFGSRLLLDGSFGTSQFQVGANANETIDVTVGSARSSSLGTNFLDTDGSITGEVVAATSNGISADTVTFSTAAGTVDVDIAADASATAIATAINSTAGVNGLSATAASSVVLENVDFAGTDTISTLSFDLNGTAISANLTNAADLSALVTAINQNGAATGVTASFANPSDTSSITLTSSDGRDIILTDVDSAGDGDDTDDTFDLISSAGTTTNATADGANDYTAVGTVRVTASNGPFTIAAGNAEVFSTTGSSFDSVTDVNLSTQQGAQNALAVIDGAIAAIDLQRGNLGAIQNRLLSTISNLQNVAENVSAARSRIQDADFAAETANLTRASILQQAGTSVLAQANALPQQALALLQ